MIDQFARTKLLIGEDNLEKLKHSKVAIFGIGGVGSFVVEGLARIGIGNFILVDNDKVSKTNLNRQLIATNSTIGKYKVEVAKERILDINKEANVEIFKDFFMPDTTGILDESIDYIVDAIDTVTSKIELVIRANKLNIPIISKVMRKELKARNIKNLKVVYSKEEPIKLKDIPNEEEKKRNVPGSVSFVPSVAGLIIAGEVVKDLIK